MTAHHTKVTPLADRLANVATQADQLLRELRSELKETRRVLKDLVAEREQAEAMVRRAVHEEIGAEVGRQLNEMAGTVKQQMESQADKVVAEFTRLSNQALYGNSHGRGVDVFTELREKLRRYEQTIDDLS